MDDSRDLDELQTEHPDPEIEIGVRFLCAIFEETDTVLFRPIETWDEAGKKQSRVDYRNTRYRNAEPELLRVNLLFLKRLSENEHVNLFFGVCPRFGGDGRFDLAWQIRTVRVLWADLDHVSVDVARERVSNSGLPPASIIVNSGNGVHLYWLLDTPYQIDDAGGDPPVVENEWAESTVGRKKPPRKYIIEHGDKVYLDKQRHASRLSAEAAHIQDVLSGIAQAIGGDHTTDLSRLMRLPGSMNRKNQRNGGEPIRAELVDCDPSQRYPLSEFERFKIESVDSVREKEIAAMPLPIQRKPSNSKSDKLADLIAASAIAPSGGRSETDFAVCCFAVRNGIDKDYVWSQVEQIGKFAEQGERYFDLTWSNAEYDVRAAKLEKLQKSMSVSGSASSTMATPSVLAETDNHQADIVVLPETQVASTLHQVTDQLLATGNCFSRTDQLVVVRNTSISTILSSAELAGLLSQNTEFFFTDGESGKYKPLPPEYGNTWLNNYLQRERLPKITLFSRNPVFTDDGRLLKPGFDPASGMFYAGPEVMPRNGTEHLDKLLRDFCFKSAADRTNYIGMLLTILLVPRFIGSKPAVLFNGNQPELGKSILAQVIAILRDGQPVETASYNPNDEEFEKRLGSIVRRGATTIIIDNAKGRSRNPRIDSACLERSITDPVLSFRLLGFSQDIRAENSHIFCITANSPNVSRDLVTRSVVVNLFYEGNPERRTYSIADPEGYAQAHRLEILGELIGMVERWKASGMPKANVHSRFNKRGWGTIIGGILEACSEPDFLANAGDAATQLDDTRREFSDLVATLADHPQGVWTAAELVTHCAKHSLLQEELGDGSPRSKATKLGVIAGRYVAERFDLSDGRKVTFHRSENRNGKVYRVGIEDEVRNVDDFAERLRNVETTQRTAP